ncbi:putative mitochondrial protein [Trifolium repens]|nr:putative mitochondrial protein [Trifolium repens]
MDELVGSLQTFEIVLDERGDKKNKSIAFVSNTDEGNDQTEDEEEDSIADAIAMLGKQFNKVLKRVDRKNRQNGQSIRFDINKQQNNLKKTKPEEKSNQSKGVQCHECEGYGHIRSECGTYQKRQKKGLTVSWSDEDTDGESESARHATAFTGTCVSVADWESDEDEDVSYDELASTYKELLTRYEEMCRILEKQKKTINKLQAKVNIQVQKATQAEEKVIQVNAQMDDLRKRVSQLNSGADLLEEIMDNVPSGKLRSVGYNYSSLNQYQQDPETKFTSGENVFDPCTGKVMLEHRTRHSKAYPVPKFALDSKPSVHQRPRPSVHQRPKNQRRYRREDWYFDSGCSIHMTGEEKYLINVRSYNASFVTFGDGAKGEIVGIGDLISHELPNLENVLLVKGLTANLISINQLCDQGMKVNFTKYECLVNNEEGQLMLRGSRSKDNCYLWMPHEEALSSTCLVSKEDEVQLWHQKLGHLNLKGMKKAMTAEAIRGLPKLKIGEGNVCGECQIGKQTRMSHPMLEHQTTSKVLELLHMDLMGPMRVESLGDTFDVFKELCIQLQREKGSNVVRIRSDHGREFENSKFNEFCSTDGIKHEYSSPITPQQNGVVERKNRTIQESARVMLHAKNIPYHFWAEAMNTACYIHNRVTLRKSTSSTLYELWKERKPTVKHFHVFGSKCYILADREQRRKLDPKSDEGIFLGYSTNSRAYRVYNSKTQVVMEYVNVVVKDTPLEKNDDIDQGAPVIDNVEQDVGALEHPSKEKSDEKTLEEDDETSTEPQVQTKGPSVRVQKNHPKDLIIGNPEQGITTRRTNDVIANTCFVSMFEPKNIKEALTDEAWIEAMQEELNQFERSEVWDLVPRPEDVNVIGTKWVYKNKLESIRLLLGVACILKFKLYQMDVKSAFLNGYLQEEVYVEQPKGFVDPEHPNYVYKLKKALYGLKQAPRAWYERLTQFLEEQGYRKGGSDKTLLVKEEKGKFIIAQIYVDDIVFGGMSNTMVQHFVKQMQLEFEMSLVGELTYFLGLQIKQMEDTTFVSQSKYARNIVKKFGMENATHKRTPAPTHLKLTKDEKGISVDQSLYRSMISSLLYLTASRPGLTYAVGVCARYQADPKVSHMTQVKRILKYVNGTSDYGIMYSHCEDSTIYGYCDADWAGNADDRKKYIAAGSSCSQLVWMKQMLKEYDVEQNALTLYCDNMSTINISKNPVQHSKTKHIDIRHHYIRDLVENKIVTLEHVGTKEQVADIFTKALDAVQFEKLRGKLGICLYKEL